MGINISVGETAIQSIKRHEIGQAYQDIIETPPTGFSLHAKVERTISTYR